ncbi:MAG TPA: AAA family ATPase [Streptosporangiaceae bacterium]|jgi:exonuclease SbcC
MRLHSLELEAIGPYATRQCIDFAALTGSGLFLLEGPTGAGKTTILDAITFALYGGLSGEAGGGDRLHSDFAGPDAKPSVTLEFAIRGTDYRIRRSPEYQRRKRRGDGLTTQAAQVHLQRHDGERWVSLSSGKAETGELLTEAIGLSREQFTQVMLLPQGEFAKFLRSDDDDRRKLLTRLFGTELYDRITAELERRRREAASARQQAQLRIQTAAAAAAEAAGLDEAGRAELLELGRADRATRFKEIGAELARTIDVSRDALAGETARLTRAQAAAERESRLAGLLTRLAEALDRLGQHEATRPEHDRCAARLADARRAEPVRPLLAELAEARAAVLAARAALAGLHPEPAADLLAEVAGDDADTDAALGGAAGSTAAGGVAAARAGEAGARADEAQRGAAELQHLAEQEAALPGRETELGALAASAALAADRVTRLELARQELPERVAALTARISEARIAAAGLASALEQRAAAADRLEAAVRGAGLAVALAELDEAARAAIDTHQQLVDAHQQAMAARLENMAAELADQLTAGAACPVCGSTEHPGPATPLDGAVSAEDVSAAARRRDAAAAAREQAETARDALAAELAGVAAVAGGGTEASLAAELAAWQERVTLAEQGTAELSELEPALAELQAEQEKLGEDLTSATAACATAQEKASRAAAELDQLRAGLAAAAQPYPTVAARQAALQQAAAADRELARALDRLSAAYVGVDRASARAAQEVAASGFASLPAAQAAVLAPEEQAALDEQVTAWAAELAVLTAGTRDDELAGLDPAGCAQAQQRAAAAAVALDGTLAAEREVREAAQALAAADERLRERLAELGRAEEESDRLAEQTDPVLRLTGLARGMDGHRRITLTTYVLRRWFEQVVQAANLRLGAMSAGRYELLRTDEGDRKNQRTGLTLAVIDRHTGEERSPRSLSGGETFYTSLALALGLADVVKAEAGGVELDTLFIDEGFGTLDAQTLDQVMSVIDELRDRGRAVGIVSHVADLQERVYERLEIRRLADGSSTTRVVA